MSAFIKADGISVDFPIYNATSRSFKKRLVMSIVGGEVKAGEKDHVIIKAIKDASFSCSPGDRIGLSGHNGSGKTTLLRTIAGVYTPAMGSLEVQGRIVSLLDLAMGMDSESTGYENIFIKGLMFGMSPSEIDKKFDQMAAFSELGRYLDIPVRTYSSGMLLRLAFSVFAQTDPDILLMDEWLSVGDAGFSEKVAKRLKEMKESTSILILASHSEELLSEICNKRWCMEHGRVSDIS